MARPAKPPPKIPLVFYRTDGGNEPVWEWLKSLDPRDRLAVGMDLQRVQYRWPVGMPLCRNLGDGLWEIRTPLPSKTIARVVVCFCDGFWSPCTDSSRRRAKPRRTT